MKIKLVNFLINSEKFHMKCDSNLHAVLQHLKSEYRDIRIHSVHPDEGPILIFKPIAKISDIEDQMCEEKGVDDFDPPSLKNQLSITRLIFLADINSAAIFAYGELKTKSLNSGTKSQVQ